MFAQTTIQFKNPSFEGNPIPSPKISGWSDCGSIEFRGVSPPDLQPGFFEVDMAPIDGSTYLGMVTRAYGSYESVCQRLDSVLIADSLYQFSIYMAKSDKYVSPVSVKDPLYRGSILPRDLKYTSLKDRRNSQRKNRKNDSSTIGVLDSVEYTHSCILRVWGGSSPCAKEELLVETAEIDHTGWKEYEILIIPTATNIKFIRLEAFYPDESIPTRGNLMLDFIHE